MSTATVLALVSGILLLYAGGESLLRGSLAVGIRMGMTPLAAGLTIVAFGTSVPELVVNIEAISVGAPGLALGNVVGSNIANIGLILGLAVLLRPAALDSRVVRREIWVMIGAAVLLMAMLWDGHVARWEGVLLIAGIAGHVLNALREARNERARTQFGAAVPKRLPSLVLAVVLITAGLGLLVVGGHLFVRGAVALAETMGVAPAVIGLSVVAIGTSLPELAASLVAAWRGYPDIAIGNVIGSNIFNVFGALGLTAAISPFGQGSVNDTDLWVMLGFSLLLMRFAHTGWRMERWEGGLLLAGFVVYLVILLT